MKHIRDYFNNHPKLKKIVKILAVLAIVFSFLFNALVISSLILGANKSVIDDREPQTKQAINGGSANDPFFAFTTTYDGVNIIEFVLAYGDIENMSVGQTKQIYNPDRLSATNAGIPFVPYGYFDPVTWASSNITHYWYRTEVYLQSTYTITGANNHSYPAYSYMIRLVEDFAGSTPSEVWCTYAIDYFPGGDYQGYSINYTSSYVPGGFLLINTHANNLWAYEQITYKSKDSYDVGYRLGYDTGYSIGYTQGQTGNNNIFTLLSQAFLSIAHILDINILPGLSIGTILFLPVIVTLIIVVFKMIKG